MARAHYAPALVHEFLFSMGQVPRPFSDEVLLSRGKGRVREGHEGTEVATDTLQTQRSPAPHSLSFVKLVRKKRQRNS